MNFELKPGDWESIRKMTTHLQIKFFILLSSEMESQESLPCNWKQQFSDTLGLRVSTINNVLEILEWDNHVLIEHNKIQTKERSIDIRPE